MRDQSTGLVPLIGKYWVPFGLAVGLPACVLLGCVIAHDAMRPAGAVDWMLLSVCGLGLGVSLFAAAAWLLMLAKSLLGDLPRLRSADVAHLIFWGLLVAVLVFGKTDYREHGDVGSDDLIEAQMGR